MKQVISGAQNGARKVVCIISMCSIYIHINILIRILIILVYINNTDVANAYIHVFVCSLAS